VFFTGAAFTIHGDTYVASQPSPHGCDVSEAVLSCLTHVSAAAIANNLAAAYACVPQFLVGLVTRSLVYPHASVAGTGDSG
jgi:hypothetical protein